MEFGGEPDRDGIRAAACAVLGIDMGIQLGDLGLGQLARELANDEAFELDADIEGVARLLQGVAQAVRAIDILRSAR